ncbi:hypothetical protein DPMN_008476 [Dreissena polymorpha]|uniref:Uncharacterized protein n=1 Tax=Dreissena polymorpha TaxID=45954 RepID=A0A9D4MW76_DREPO|nr:hypothetical protein DPMN_008476 [Dreissena polymorpha]
MTLDDESQCQLEAERPKSIIYLHQDDNHHRYMEWLNHVRDRENCTRGRRDEEVEPHHPRNQRINTDWLPVSYCCFQGMSRRIQHSHME